MTRTIADVRASQEVVKDHWSSIVREAIADALRRKGEFHADELADLGIPDEHRNIIGSQIARLVNQGWMVECGRRKSEIPSRNGAKSNLYRLTRAGFAGVGAGAAVTASADSGEQSAHGEGTPSSQEPARHPMPVPSADSRSGGSGVTSRAPEPARLFDPPPEPPRSAWTDAEAA